VPFVARHFALDGRQGNVADGAMVLLRVLPQALVQGIG
jgi:hypothetical protein